MDNIKKTSLNSKSKSSHSKNDKIVICEVLHLDPVIPNLKTNIKVTEPGSILFNKVCDTFGGTLERDYFGLKFLDKHGQQQWLELNVPITKQIKDKSHGDWIQVFCFRFKHYPRNPLVDLQQDLSKYLLYLQLRQDLHCGRLVAPLSVQYRMASLVLQAESEGFDAFDPEQVPLSELNILPSINGKDEANIISDYETVKDLDPFEAEKSFLEEASKLDTYGVERVAVKDQKENDICIGITYNGVSTYSGNKLMHTFPWPNILKISFTHKLFMVKVLVEKKKHILGFKCATSYCACALWKFALDRKWFITLDRASEARLIKSGGSFLGRKKSHTFSGRSQRELTTSCQTLPKIPQPRVNRTHSMMTLLKSCNSRTESAAVNGNLASIGSGGYSIVALPLEEHAIIPNESTVDDVEFPEKSVKENGFRNKSSAAGIGTVLNFMDALRETPIKEIESIRNSNTELNISELDNSCEESEKTNFDEESNLFSELMDLVEKEQNAIPLTCSQNLLSAAANEISHRDDLDQASVRSDEDKSPSNLSRVSVSVVVIFASIIFLGIFGFFYVIKSESSLAK